MNFLKFLIEAKETFYHGSKQEITTFSMDNLGKGTGINQEGPGIYLTTSPKDAARYGKVYQVDVKLVKSRMMPEKRLIPTNFVRILIYRSPNRDDILQNWDENPQRALDLAVDSIMDAYGPNDYREAMEQIWADFYPDHPQKYLSKMVVAGWDGFIIDRGQGIKHFICFNPEILKVVGLVNG